jgi:hypothetical protein
MRKRTKRRKNILTIDVRGSHVKVMTSKVRKKREFPSGSHLFAKAMVKKIKDLTKDWSMTSFRWVIQDPSFSTAHLQSHTISVTDGPASISQGPSTVQPGSSTTH